MSTWDREYCDEVEPARLDIGARSAGSLVFGYVQAELDHRLTKRNGRQAVEFSWRGVCELEEDCGRGWAAIIESGDLEGHIFFHQGDESSFRARRVAEPSTKRRSSSTRRSWSKKR